MSLPLALFSAFLCPAIAMAIEFMMGECRWVCVVGALTEETLEIFVCVWDFGHSVP